MRYLLNSAVITAPGVYEYRLIDAQTARVWLESGAFVSTCGYAETAAALEQLCGVPIPVNRQIITMQTGDEALVFRLVLPPGSQRVAPGSKGNLSVDFIAQHCEIGLLRRRE
jgi:uncharacterized protein DUF1874